MRTISALAFSLGLALGLSACGAPPTDGESDTPTEAAEEVSVGATAISGYCHVTPLTGKLTGYCLKTSAAGACSYTFNSPKCTAGITPQAVQTGCGGNTTSLVTCY